jgi:diphthine methyl ester synthase
MVLYVVGLGLWDEKDITLRGLEAVRGSVRVYLEAYTSILMSEDYREKLEELYGKSIILAHRETVELESDAILSNAQNDDVSFCVVGDPLSATTHTDLILRARQSVPPIPVKIIHNASIMTAIASSGLQPYNFGQTISVPFWTETWKPDSWMARIAENMQIGNHTLVLSDIKVREQSEYDMARGIERFQPPRYMMIPQLITQLLAASSHAIATEQPQNAILSAETTLAVALCRMGTDTELILSGTLGELLALASPSIEELQTEEEQDEADEMASEQELEKRRSERAQIRAIKAFGPPLHSLVLVGKRLHHLERDYAAMHKVPGSKWDEVAREVYGCKEE